jgi:hypothetical protein
MHDCAACGRACYRHGDLDDCEVETPEYAHAHCTGCGCEAEGAADVDDDDDREEIAAGDYRYYATPNAALCGPSRG